ncbi:MAG: HPr kinase/phosphatase C-terminal domain-containing protein [Hyphomicrobiales bacterium]|nr:HPr kinase/phosphatase C-terminal domain-containing protein [Hyphomicrobiales bacterium]
MSAGRSDADTESVRVHATCVALGDRAALLRGPPGAGKSDLALRFMDAPPMAGGAALVADDQTILERRNGRVMARAPDLLAGKLEVRGLGVFPAPHLAEAELCLIVDLVGPDEIGRAIPQPLPVEHVLGAPIPVIALSPFEASAARKLRLALHFAPNLNDPVSF